MKQLDQSFVGACVSEGTLKENDLLDKFNAFAVHNLSGKERKELLDLIQEASDAYNNDDIETCSFIINEDIWDLMNEIAPEGTMFSSHIGNGACFGFWTIEEE